MKGRRFRARRPADERGRGGGKGRAPARRPEGEAQDFWSRLLASAGGADNEFLERTACPACEQMPARILSRLGPTILRKCRACGLVYISPRLSDPVREEMYRRNPATLNSERNLMLRHLMAERLQNMHREMFHVPGVADKTASLLEVGSGWGHFLQLCRPHYREVEGLELSKEQAAHARERFDLKVSSIDILRDPWPRQYSMIVAWELLEHLSHPFQFMEWAHAHLQPGGQLVLSTPNFDSLYRRLLGSHWFYAIPSQHLSYYTPHTVKAQLLKAGFEDVAIHTSGRSLFRERWNKHNQIDRRQDHLGQWLQTLRIREQIELERERTALDQSHPIRKIWHGVMWRAVNALAVRGMGDQMRVYAVRK